MCRARLSRYDSWGFLACARNDSEGMSTAGTVLLSQTAECSCMPPPLLWYDSYGKKGIQ